MQAWAIVEKKLHLTPWYHTPGWCTLLSNSSLTFGYVCSYSTCASLILFFVLDEHAIEMSSKSVLGYLTAAYRTQVRLFVSVSVLAPFAYYIVLLFFFTLFSRPVHLSTRMWCVVAVGGSRSSSTDPGICAASNCRPWPLYQGIDHYLWGTIGNLTSPTCIWDTFLMSYCSLSRWIRLSVVCNCVRHCSYISCFKIKSD